MHPGACAEVSKALRVLSLAPASAQAGGTVNVQGETQKGMDVVANDLFVSALTGHVAAMASEEEEEAIAGAANRKYEIAFDPPDPDPNPNPNPNPNLNPNPDPDPNPITLTRYEIAFDPLDGSSNLDTNLPTGSIFCVLEHTPGQIDW